MNSSHYKSPGTKSIHGSLALVLGCLSAVLFLEQLPTSGMDFLIAISNCQRFSI